MVTPHTPTHSFGTALETSVVYPITEMEISMRLADILAARERSDMALQDVDEEGEEEYNVEIHADKHRDEVERHVCYLKVR